MKGGLDTYQQNPPKSSWGVRSLVDSISHHIEYNKYLLVVINLRLFSYNTDNNNNNNNNNNSNNKSNNNSNNKPLANPDDLINFLNLFKELLHLI